MFHKGKEMNISGDSMMQLKAELIKKQDEFKRLKLENSSRPIKRSKIETKSSVEKKNVGVDKRSQKDVEEKLEELNTLQKSKNILEKKAKLYEKMSQQMLGDENYQKLPFLVDFEQKVIDKSIEKKQKQNLLEEKMKAARAKLTTNEKNNKNLNSTCKPGVKRKNCTSDDDEDDDEYKIHGDDDDGDDGSLYMSKNPDEQWVEFEDSLGRTRRCLKKDVEHFKSLDKKLNITKPELKEQIDNSAVEPELMSNDMRKEMERRRWEEEVAKMRMKDEIHYSDVTFNEIRDHGVGFYNFARDEETRKEQMKVLNQLRQQTKIQRKMFSSLKEKRKRALDIRLAKVMQRSIVQQAIRLSGLDPLTFIDKNSTFMTSVYDDNDNENDDAFIGPQPSDMSDNNADDMSGKKCGGDDDDDDVIEEWKRDDSWRKNAPVREWDVGKKSELFYEDEMWKKKRRSERVEEFAPPTAFYDSQSDDRLLGGKRKNKNDVKLNSRDFFKSKSHFYNDSGDVSMETTEDHKTEVKNDKDNYVLNDDYISLDDQISANLKEIRSGSVCLDGGNENNNNIENMEIGSINNSTRIANPSISSSSSTAPPDNNSQHVSNVCNSFNTCNALPYNNNSHDINYMNCLYAYYNYYYNYNDNNNINNNTSAFPPSFPPPFHLPPPQHPSSTLSPSFTADGTSLVGTLTTITTTIATSTVASTPTSSTLPATTIFSTTAATTTTSHEPQQPHHQQQQPQQQQQQQASGPQPAHFSCGPTKCLPQSRPARYEPINIHEIPLTLPPPLSTSSSSQAIYPSQEKFIGNSKSNNNHNNEQRDIKKWQQQFNTYNNNSIINNNNNNDNAVVSNLNTLGQPVSFPSSSTPSSSSLSISELKPSSLPFASSFIQLQQLGKSISDRAAEQFDPNVPPPNVNHHASNS